MAKLYRSREGEATAVDTKTQLTTLGSETAPGPLLVPAQAKRLLGVWVAGAPDSVAVGRANLIIRLEGGGLPGGPEVLTAGAYGYNIVTGGTWALNARHLLLDVPVTPGNEILIFAEMTGVDIGSIAAAVTLIFTI